jgi:hypothetical protein
MKRSIESILTGSLVVGAGLALVLATSGCANKGCDPKPIPKAYAEISELVPQQSTICGEQNGALRVYFKNITSTKDAHAEMVKIASAKGWAKSSESTEGPPTMTLIKGPSKVDVTYPSYKDAIYVSLELGAIQ